MQTKFLWTAFRQWAPIHIFQSNGSLRRSLSPFFLCRKGAATRRLLPLDSRVQCHAIQQKDFVAGIRWNLFKFLTELYN